MPTRDTHLTLTVDWPEITIDRLARITQLWAALVESVSNQAARKRRAVKWVVTGASLSSPYRLTATPEAATENVNPVIIEAVSRAIVSGVTELQSDEPVTPRFYAPASLKLVKQLALEANPLEGRRLIVSNGTAVPAEFTAHVVAAVDEIVGPTVESYGSIEGRFQGLDTHGRKRFYIWESLSGRRVRCYFNETLDLDELLAGYEQRVSVSGIIQSRPSGRRISIDVKRFSILKPDDQLRSSDEILKRWEAIR